VRPCFEKRSAGTGRMVIHQEHEDIKGSILHNGTLPIFRKPIKGRAHHGGGGKKSGGKKSIYRPTVALTIKEEVKRSGKVEKKKRAKRLTSLN